VLPQANTVCPNCNFRDIEPCPYCNQEIGRLAYLSVAGDIFRCPSCQRRVQFRFNDPLFDDEEHFRQPVVLSARARCRPMEFDTEGHILITPWEVEQGAFDDPDGLISHGLLPGTPMAFPTYRQFCQFLNYLADETGVHAHNF